jgi:hypothetical protein
MAQEPHHVHTDYAPGGKFERYADGGEDHAQKIKDWWKNFKKKFSEKD